MSNSAVLSRLLGDEVVKQDGDRFKVSDFPGQVLGLYFSAGWCNSCKIFNQQLSTFCKEFDKDPDRRGTLQVVYVSSDRTETQFNESFQELPLCYALPYHERAKKVRHSAKFFLPACLAQRVGFLPQTVCYIQVEKLNNSELIKLNKLSVLRLPPPLSRSFSRGKDVKCIAIHSCSDQFGRFDTILEGKLTGESGSGCKMAEAMLFVMPGCQHKMADDTLSKQSKFMTEEKFLGLLYSHKLNNTNILENIIETEIHGGADFGGADFGARFWCKILFHYLPPSAFKAEIIADHNILDSQQTPRRVIDMSGKGIPTSRLGVQCSLRNTCSDIHININSVHLSHQCHFHCAHRRIGVLVTDIVLELVRPCHKHQVGNPKRISREANEIADCVVNTSPFSNVGLNHPDHVIHLQSNPKATSGYGLTMVFSLLPKVLCLKVTLIALTSSIPLPSPEVIDKFNYDIDSVGTDLRTNRKTKKKMAASFIIDDEIQSAQHSKIGDNRQNHIRADNTKWKRTHNRRSTSKKLSMETPTSRRHIERFAHEHDFRFKTLEVGVKVYTGCPPCKALTPQLAETYRKLRSRGEKLEVMFISSDRSEESFKQYFSTMPWTAVPYEDDKRRRELALQFQVEEKAKVTNKESKHMF
ncbi:Nucleoredoxin [Nymphon striatum]|nr:Nucleoredoxin [Nymphon striatum]